MFYNNLKGFKFHGRSLVVDKSGILLKVDPKNENKSMIKDYELDV